jgi:hypothetical protein
MTQHDDDRRVDEIERRQLDEHDRQFGLDYFLSLRREEAEREARMAGADFAAQFAAGERVVAQLIGMRPREASGE